MILYNYSGLKKRDNKIYSVAGTKVSTTGISTSFLTVIGPSFLVWALLFIGITVAVGKGSVYIPLSPNFNLIYTIISLFGGIGVGCIFWYVKIETYRLYEYLIAYFKPKKTYHNLNTRNKEFKLYNIKTDGFISNDF